VFLLEFEVVLSYIKNILIISSVALVGFLVSNKEYRNSFDRFLRKLKKSLEDRSAYYLAFIIIIAAILRLNHLCVREFWYDEAFTSILIRRPWDSFFTFVLKDLHPPFYYMCLKAWSLIFGFSDFGLRSFSVFFGILLIPLIYGFVKKLSGNKILALTISIVFAVNPFLIRYSQEARSYSFLVFLIIGAIYSLYNRRWFLFSLLFSITIFTHYVSIFLLPSLLIFAGSLYFKSRDLSMKGLLSLLLPTALLVFWAPIFKDHFDHANTLLGWVAKPRFIDLINSVETLFFGESVTGLKSLSIIIFIFGVSAYFFTKATKEIKLKGLFLLLFSLLPFLEVFLVSRYLNISLYINRVLIGFLAIFMVYLVFSSLQVLGKYFGVAIILWYVFTAVVFNSHIEMESKGYKKLIEFAQSSSRTIVMTDPKQYGTLKHYLDKNTFHLIKVQSDFDGYWPLIFPEDTVDKAKIKTPFYLTHEGPISDWTPEIKVGKFYLYNWEN